MTSTHVPKGIRRVAWGWLVVLVLTFLVAIALLYSPVFKGMVESATRWAQGVMTAHPVAGAVVFFLFSAVSAMLAFASTAVLVAPANLVWGKWVTFLLLWGGWLAGAAAAYGIGRVASPLLIRMGYQKTLEEYRQFVSQRMRFWTVLLFCMAVPSEVPGYLFGGAHYPIVRFLVAMGLAEAVYAVGTVIAGESLVVARPAVLLSAVGALVAIGMVAGLLLRTMRRREGRLPSH